MRSLRCIADDAGAARRPAVGHIFESHLAYSFARHWPQCREWFIALRGSSLESGRPYNRGNALETIRLHGPPGRIACKIGLTVQTVSTIIRELELQDFIIGAREVPKFRGYAATALPSPSLKRRSSNQLRNS